jgi:hypothetical protein
MRFAAGLALLLAFGAMTACGQDEEEGQAKPEPPSEAVVFVSKVYEPYTDDKDADPVQPEGSEIYSKRLRALLDKDAADTPDGEVGRLDFDPIVDGQDWEIGGLTLKEVYRSGGEARVRADFANFGKPRSLLFSLVRERSASTTSPRRCRRAGPSPRSSPARPTPSRTRSRNTGSLRFLRALQRGLRFLVRDVRVDDRPAWRASRPDCDLRPGQRRVVERAAADAQEMRPRLGSRGHRRPADGAETAMHSIAAVRRARIVGELALEAHGVGREDDIDRGVAGGELLAVGAPAGPDRDRCSVDLVTYRTAQTAAGRGHGFPPVIASRQGARRAACAQAFIKPQGLRRRRGGR